jgi:hypothetical protein
MRGVTAEASRSPNEQIYLGIDIAGDKGATGVVQIVEEGETRSYRILPGPWKRKRGLRRMADRVKESTLTAVDQPFAYAAATMQLLLNQDVPVAELDAQAFCSRKTDSAMREILKGYELPADYVMSPNRCHNIWRALALASSVGLSREEVCSGRCKLFETHPRVAWTRILAQYVDRHGLFEQIDGFKKKPQDKKENEDSAQEEDQAPAREQEGASPQCELRSREMLSQLEAASGLRPEGNQKNQELVRDQLCRSADLLEALAAAFVAYLHSKSQTELALPRDSTIDKTQLSLEGAAVLPLEKWSLPCPEVLIPSV